MISIKKQKISPSSAISPDDRGERGFVVRFPILALLFLILASPTIFIQVYCTPPIQVADEENHFLRALQIADGHLFGHKLGNDTAGGEVDPAASTLAHDFDALKFKPDQKLDESVYQAAAALGWESASAAPVPFPNTAIYPFFLYVPASTGIAAGRALHLSVLDSFYLGRLATALASVAIASLALALCGQGRTLLFVILCFPMTLSLFASVSQDAMSIALGALAAAIWSRYAARGIAMTAPMRAAVALALGAVVAARIPLAPLYVLALLPTRPWTGARPRLVDVAAGAAGLVPLLIGIYGAHAAKVAFRSEDGVSPIGQVRWMAVHPLDAVMVAERTLSADTMRHLHEIVGVLGWLDTDLPPGFYSWMGVCAAAALLIDAAAGRRNSGFWGLVPAIAALIASAGVFGALYLAWTPVGAPIVDGVQGRYFIVPALVLAVSTPSISFVRLRAEEALERMQILLCGAVALVDLWIVPTTILHRFYG